MLYAKDRAGTVYRVRPCADPDLARRCCIGVRVNAWTRRPVKNARPMLLVIEHLTAA